MPPLAIRNIVIVNYMRNETNTKHHVRRTIWKRFIFVVQPLQSSELMLSGTEKNTTNRRIETMSFLIPQALVNPWINEMMIIAYIERALERIKYIEDGGGENFSTRIRRREMTSRNTTTWRSNRFWICAKSFCMSHYRRPIWALKLILAMIKSNQLVRVFARICLNGFQVAAETIDWLKVLLELIY